MEPARDWEHWHEPKVIEGLKSSWMHPSSGDARKELYGVLKDLYKPGWSLCDFGCGPGVDSKPISEQGWDYTGCDRTSELIEIAKKEHPDFPFYKDDIFKSWQANDAYDVVLCSDVLVHLPKITGPLATLYRLAKRFVVIKICYLTHMPTYQYRDNNGCVVHYFNPTSFIDMLRLELSPQKIGVLISKVDNPMSNEQAIFVLHKEGDKCLTSRG